jgi:hypothetical protein
MRSVSDRCDTALEESHRCDADDHRVATCGLGALREPGEVGLLPAPAAVLPCRQTRDPGASGITREQRWHQVFDASGSWSGLPGSLRCHTMSHWRDTLGCVCAVCACQMIPFCKEKSTPCGAMDRFGTVYARYRECCEVPRAGPWVGFATAGKRLKRPSHKALEKLGPRSPDTLAVEDCPAP